MRKAFVVILGLAGATAAFAAWWRDHPRFGATWVNRVVDPWLVRQGIVAESKGELGMLEHIGRTSGTVRITPVHPVRTPDGFRIIVPLGYQSQWALNVLAAGHCRLQVGETIHELDEPKLVMPSAVDGLPTAATRVMEWLGFRYLELHEFATSPGVLEVPAASPSNEAPDLVEPAIEPSEGVSEPIPVN